MSDTETQIDVVYLWVNSNDKKWQNKRRNSFDIFLKNDKDNIAFMQILMDVFVIMESSSSI